MGKSVEKAQQNQDTIHLIGTILAPLMLRVLQEKESFDLDVYTRLLKKYKTRNPNKIPDLLENEPDLFAFFD